MLEHPDENKQIIGATCQYSVSNSTALHEKRFDLVLIDEAAQAAEPDVVLPLFFAIQPCVSHTDRGPQATASLCEASTSAANSAIF